MSEEKAKQTWWHKLGRAIGLTLYLAFIAAVIFSTMRFLDYLFPKEEIVHHITKHYICDDNGCYDIPDKLKDE